MAQLDDLARLPDDVRARARVYDNGEISWPIADASRAINSLADAGLVILGIDVRRHDDAGHTWETAWSDFSSTERYRESMAAGTTPVEEARRHALQAVGRETTAEFGDWILLTW